MTIEQEKLEAIMTMQSKLTVVANTAALLSTQTWPNLMTDTSRSVIIEGLELLKQDVARNLSFMHKEAITPVPVVEGNTNQPLALVSDQPKETETTH